MNMKATFIALFLFASILLTSCANDPQPSQDGDGVENTEQTVTETPVASDPDPFENVRKSEEDWLAYGLSAYENNKEIVDLKEFFPDIVSLHYLTLYDHLFAYDKDKYIPFAEALFAFIYNEYGADALLDIDKRCEYKTAFLKSLGLDMEYIQTKEIETFFANMDFRSNALYRYIMSFDNVTYYFKDLDAGAVQEYNSFLYYSTTGLFELIDYLKENELSGGLDTDREFRYYVTFDGSYSKTVNSNGNIYLNDSFSGLHEAMHAMGLHNKSDIWLSEGLCNYFGYSLGFHDLVAASYAQIFKMIEQGYYDERATNGDIAAILCKKLYEKYTALGGKYGSYDEIDFRLYTDSYARAELEIGSYSTIAEAYIAINNKECNSVGKELSYQQAHSLVYYLIDIYGLEKVLDAYHEQNVEAVFGKDYETLKADWLSSLE